MNKGFNLETGEYFYILECEGCGCQYFSDDEGCTFDFCSDCIDCFEGEDNEDNEDNEDDDEE